MEERERKILSMLSRQEVAAANGAVAAELDAMVKRGWLKVRNQMMLDGGSKVNSARMFVKKFYRTTKAGRAALQKVGTP